MGKRLKVNMKGDGLSFYNAVRNSDLSVEEVYKGMGVVKQTLYNYFDEEVLDDNTKEKAASILKKTVEEIFGLTSKAINRSSTVISRDQALRNSDIQDIEQNKGSLPIVVEVAIKLLGELYRSPDYLIPVNDHLERVSVANRKDRVTFAFEEADTVINVYNTRMLSAG